MANIIRESLMIGTGPQGAVDAWRGKMMQHFALAEAAVTEALIAISEAGHAVELRQLRSQRFDELGKRLGEEGVLKRTKAVSMLNDFRKFDPFRNTLAHGVLSIACEPDQRWVAIWRYTNFKEQPAQVEMLWSQAKAQALLQELVQAEGKLTAELAKLTNHLRRTRPTKAETPPRSP